MSRLIVPTFFTPDRRLVPPAFQASINWSHPIAKGLKFFGLATPNGGALDLVTNQLRYGTSPTFTFPDPVVGIGRSSSGAAFPTRPDVGFNNPISGWAQFRVHASGNYADLISVSSYTSESNNQGWGIQKRPSSDGKPGLAIYTFNNNSSASYAFQSTINTEAASQGGWQMGYTNDGTTRRIYLNGNIDNSTTSNVTMAAVASPSIGMGSPDARTGAAAIWNRRVEAWEYRELWRNPWCFLTPSACEGIRFTDAGASITWHTSAIKVRTA